MSIAEKFISENSLSQFEMKKYYPVTSLHDLLTFVYTYEVSPITKNNIDGVIL
jgi:hypothetical protein